ncbi:autoinducer kinase [Escherichia coli]|nr:autoinducer-2 (AI-2) kinase [Escherichia coli O111:H8 str. CVM9570]MBE7960686.1 autoinducer kinase [Escherichia coli]
MARLFTPSESKDYLLALDAGTGSIRAVIFDLKGNQIAVGQAEWRHLAVPDVPGSMEFDLNKNWQLACECMRQALHNAGIDPEYIAAVSACSMREGIVLYNNEGTPIWACANVDARAAREVSELKELHNNTFENEVYRATGQTLALSAIPRLLWLAHHRSDIYRQASTITMISDWLAYMLSGELASVPEFFHQWQKPENAWFAGNGRTHQTRKSMNFIRIHAISGRQFIRISWGWLIMD